MVGKRTSRGGREPWMIHHVYIMTMKSPSLFPSGVWVLVFFKDHSAGLCSFLIRSLSEGRRKGSLSIDFLLMAFWKMYFSCVSDKLKCQIKSVCCLLWSRREWGKYKKGVVNCINNIISCKMLKLSILKYACGKIWTHFLCFWEKKTLILMCGCLDLIQNNDIWLSTHTVNRIMEEIGLQLFIRELSFNVPCIIQLFT